MSKIDQSTRDEYKVPLYCPVCSWIMKGSKSTDTYFKFRCCSPCHMDFVEHREERWKDGWRPDDERLQNALRVREGLGFNEEP